MGCGCTSRLKLLRPDQSFYNTEALAKRDCILQQVAKKGSFQLRPNYLAFDQIRVRRRSFLVLYGVILLRIGVVLPTCYLLIYG